MPLTFMFLLTQKCVGGVLYAKSGVNIIVTYAIANFSVSIRGVGKRNTLLELEVRCIHNSFWNCKIKKLSNSFILAI
jgi:hypothetical protein